MADPAVLKGHGGLFGLLQQSKAERLAGTGTGIDESAIEIAIAARLAARAARNWA